MKEYLKEGMTLYHRKNKTKCIITALMESHDYILITVLCDKLIGANLNMTFRSDAIGEFLFFSEEDIDADIENLIKDESYLAFKNKKILSCYNERIMEEKRLKELKKVKLLEEARKQKEVEELEKIKKLEEELKTKDINEILIEKLDTYGFEGFHHYTDFSNFLSIMNTGFLYSRNLAIKKKVIKNDSANKDIIQKTQESNKNVLNYVRMFYHSCPPTLYSWEGIKDNCDNKPHMPIPVLLVFDKNIINHKDIYLTNGNASSNYTRFTKDRKKALLEFDWSMIFSKGPYERIFYGLYDITKISRSAEILYPSKISIDNINAVIFRTTADYKNAVNILGENEKFYVDDDYSKFNHWYSYCKNYLKDYCIEKIQDKLELIMQFATINNLQNYNHELIIKYGDNEYIKIIDNIEELIDLNGPKVILNLSDFIEANKNFEICYYMNGHRIIYCEVKND